MKFVAIIDGKKTGDGRITTFLYDEPGPLPPIIDPPASDEPKDTEPPKPAPKPS
jgi:hypothetical protein